MTGLPPMSSALKPACLRARAVTEGAEVVLAEPAVAAQIGGRLAGAHHSRHTSGRPGSDARPSPAQSSATPGSSSASPACRRSPAPCLRSWCRRSSGSTRTPDAPARLPATSDARPTRGRGSRSRRPDDASAPRREIRPPHTRRRRRRSRCAAVAPGRVASSSRPNTDAVARVRASRSGAPPAETMRESETTRPSRSAHSATMTTDFHAAAVGTGWR